MALQQDRARWANMLVERGVVSSLAAIDKDGQPSARPGPPRPTLLVRALVRTHSRIVDPRIVGLVSQIENCAETPVESKRRAAVATHVRCRTTAIRDKRALERVHGAAQVFSPWPARLPHTVLVPRLEQAGGDQQVLVGARRAGGAARGALPAGARLTMRISLLISNAQPRAMAPSQCIGAHATLARTARAHGPAP